MKALNILETRAGISFQLKVRPASGRQRLLKIKGGVLKAEVTAPPVGGKANRDVIKLISKSLNVPKSSVKIEKGETTSRKRIAVSGINQKDLWRKLHEKSLV